MDKSSGEIAAVDAASPNRTARIYNIQPYDTHGGARSPVQDQLCRLCRLIAKTRMLADAAQLPALVVNGSPRSNTNPVRQHFVCNNPRWRNDGIFLTVSV